MIETGTIKIRDKEIYYEWINKAMIEEDKPVIVFLHHGLGSVAQWGSYPAKLSKNNKLPVLLFDRYGHGKSAQLDGARNTDFIQEEGFDFLPLLLAKLAIKQKIVLYGHSDGGSIALVYASHFSHKLKAVIVEAPHVIIEDITKQGLLNSVNEFKHGNLKELLERYHKEKTESMFYGWSNAWLEEGQEEWNILDQISNISVPTMVIYGDQDEYGTLLQAEKIKERLNGNTEILAIKEGNHFPHKQHEKMILTETSEFLMKCI